MVITVQYEIIVPDDCVGKLVQEASERGCGSVYDVGRKELITRLCINGGEDIIQQICEDTANTHVMRIKN